MKLEVSRRGGLVGAGELASWVPVKGQLTLEHRTFVQVALRQQWTLRRIAGELGVSASTVSREVRRNRLPDGSYQAGYAHAKTCERRVRPKPGKLVAGSRLRAEVVARLNDFHSPREISGRLAKDFPGQDNMQVSHETIYQALYVQGRGSLRQELNREKALRSGRQKRIPQSRVTGRPQSSWIGPEVMITQRPAEADDRAVPGHWEGDLVLGARNESALITLVERHSRYGLLQRLDTHDTITVTGHLTRMIGQLPASLQRSLAWDQGSEMANHAAFTIATGCRVFFCDPHSPWQRGSNENFNGLVREFFPKGTDFTQVSDEDVARAEKLLNTRPRETLHWDTPAEILAPQIGVALTP